MRLKEMEWSNCKCCGTRDKVIQEEEYGCDTCETVIRFDPEATTHLELTVFTNNDEDSRSKNYQFCSWSCVLEKLKTLDTDYFMSLPHLYFEDDYADKLSIKGFLDAINPKTPKEAQDGE